VRDETIQQNTAGKRREGAGDQLEESGFAAGVGTEDSDDFAGTGLETIGFEREERRLRWVGGVSVADLFDAEADRARGAGGVA
jgi:hypothetical protein